MKRKLLFRRYDIVVVVVVVEVVELRMDGVR
jgi:hypothetical protein